ncbi:MAG: hypothetical protein ACI8S6_001756 [Myxococcota bacterium]|jgi:hypothetical protein
MADTFYRRDGDLFHPTELTRGPWDNHAQHGGPPAALLAGAMARYGDDSVDWFLARIGIELLRPIPLAPLRLRVEPVRLGRSVQRLHASLWSGERCILTATGTRIRRALVDVPVAVAVVDAWPDPESLPRFTFPFFRHAVGYHRAIELVVAVGVWGGGQVGVWARTETVLVEGQVTSPLEQLMIIADAQSGMGMPLDPDHFTFVNPDLTVYFERDPVGGWLGFDVRSVANGHGSGLSQSAIRDGDGLVARSAQSLVVASR